MPFALRDFLTVELKEGEEWERGGGERKEFIECTGSGEDKIEEEPAIELVEPKTEPEGLMMEELFMTPLELEEIGTGGGEE